MATKFTVTLQASGGDYSVLQTLETALDSNLTTAVVLSHGGITGAITDASAVTGATSGATGTALHVTATQIMITPTSGTFQTGEQIYKTIDVNYVTSSSAPDSVQLTVKIDDTWSSNDTTALTIDGWTTGSANYIEIYPTSTARHSRVWNTTTAYRLVTSTIPAILIAEEYVRIYGLQVECTGAKSSAARGIRINTNNATSDIRIIGCILRATGSGTPSEFCNGIQTLSRCHLVAADNIRYGWNNGICFLYEGTSTTNQIAYNNTCVDNNNNGIRYEGGTTYANIQNNLCSNNTTDFTLTSPDSTTTNMSGDATSPQTGLRNKDAAFTDYAGDNFTISSTSDAIDVGTDLSGDSYYTFSDDPAGNQTRSGTWDIGAFEYVSVEGGLSIPVAMNSYRQRRG